MDMNKIELFREPLNIKRVLLDNNAEMSDLQHALLCGLIKQYKPKKIVEVGVAAGGTTAVILNCIFMLELDSEVYSVDSSEKYYRDGNKNTGYLVEECKNYLGKEVKHCMHVGGYLPEYLDEIGDNIDFLILDTMHTLPGELLDFLACLPRLNDGAIVVLHDIILNHLTEFADVNAIATRVLLSSVVGKKIICRENDNQYNYIGLGAFEVTKETRKYIENVFSALLMTWNYIPDSEQIGLYRKHFLRYYSNDLVEEYDTAVEMNRNTLLKKRMVRKDGLYGIYELINKLADRKNIFIYGCGMYGTKLFDCLESFGVKIEGYVISDNQVKPEIDKRVEYISDIESSDCTFVLGMNVGKQKDICQSDKSDNWINVGENVLSILRNCL
ncbi:class I SAM-dependent methyltransferase [Parablautia intestinalis]|uniref:Class I SAM-dependent methyltransferase n=1 Tax=Parablautia intestinalis TaxID=2320100 RepID=A0A3A9AMC1_9FIRM|nr:class I SAM-dependent methyltransferase [Parablautia intestinalis]RKI88653.1 class I SAM-dependent methyltransferase [Parablautia intestinalis]